MILDTMQLYRYHPWCIQKLVFTNHSYFVRFNSHRPETMKEVIFVSTQSFQSASFASNYLSLTYKPRHRYSFDSDVFALTDNEGNSVDDRLNRNYTRSWPAFGKHGGGVELIMESNENEVSIPLTDDLYLDGGSFDQFHQDAILPFNLSAMKTVAETTAMIFETSLEGRIGYVKEGSIAFKWKHGERQFTISVGIKEMPDGMILHIWGAKWRDNNTMREIICNVEDELQVIHIGKESLRSEFDSNLGTHFTEFTEKIKKVAHSLLKSENCDFYWRGGSLPCHHLIYFH